MRIIDGHTHIKDLHPEWMGAMEKRYGVDKYAVLSLSMSDNPLNNPTCLYTKLIDPGRAYAFCGLTHPVEGQKADFAAQLDMWIAAGFDGWKILETKPNYAKRLNVAIDDMRFDEAFAFAETRGLPITWHVGDPAPFWREGEAPDWAVRNGWAYVDGTYPSLETLYEQTENVLKRHPLLKVAFAHLFFTSDDEAHARRLFAQYPNLRLDITPGSEMYDAFADDLPRWRKFFLDYSDRLIYGTDLETAKVDPAVGPTIWAATFVRQFLTEGGEMELHGRTVRGMGLPETAVANILGGNYERFVSEEPKPVDAPKAEKACLWTAKILRDAGKADKAERAEAIAEAFRNA